MQKTDLLNLPIYDMPSADKFHINDFNTGMSNLENFAQGLVSDPKQVNIINQEVVDARGTKANLKDRLDNTENIIGYYIYVEDFPKLDGEPDDTGRIKRALASITDKGTLRFANKTYYISETLYIQPRIKLVGEKNTAQKTADLASSMWSNIQFRGTNIEIGESSWVNRSCTFDCDVAKIKIGKNCAVGMDTLFLTNTHEIGDEKCRCGKNFKKGITIEDGCWIGARTTILPNVTIGKGCVIGAGSLVNKDCEPNGLYVGTPARRVKDLPFDNKVLKIVNG